MTKPYRKNVIAVIKGKDRQVMVFERSDKPGNFQFPQGGIDEGETEKEALLRELKEEIGTEKFSIIKIANENTTYDFPAKMDSPITKNYRGQSQSWFLVELLEGELPKLELSDGEFISYKWCEPVEIIQSIVYWKKDSYSKGLELLGIKV